MSRPSWRSMPQERAKDGSVAEPSTASLFLSLRQGIFFTTSFTSLDSKDNDVPSIYIYAHCLYLNAIFELLICSSSSWLGIYLKIKNLFYPFYPSVHFLQSSLVITSLASSLGENFILRALTPAEYGSHPVICLSNAYIL